MLRCFARCVETFAIFAAKGNLFARKQKSEAFLLRSLRCVCKPDSVIKEAFTSSNVRSCIWDECCHSPQAALPTVISIENHGWTRPCTQVGTFAVSSASFDATIPFGTLASRHRRFCSHPLDYPGGRYPLPYSTLSNGRVRTFLPITQDV